MQIWEGFVTLEVSTPVLLLVQLKGETRVSIHSGCHHRKLQVCGCLLATTSVSKDQLKSGLIKW